MYTSCLFCSARLGTNQELEHLPVGRSVALDPRRGRLWVVCSRCRRWNLCPFEERWEALEEGERLARESAVHEAGEELSLLRHPSGLSLIRVGKPTLAELVSWRFARSLVWRRRAYAGTFVGLTGGAGLVALGGALGLGAGVGITAQLLLAGKTYRDLLWPVVRMETSDGRELRLTAAAARGATFVPSEEGPVLAVDFSRTNARGNKEPHRLRGPDIQHFIARAMPYINEEGASERVAIEAAAEIRDRGGAEAFLDSVATDSELHAQATYQNRLRGIGREGVLAKLPRPIRLAMEAASHVQQEDRVLSGELEGVIEEWRRAEEIAGIADRLEEPRGWRAFRARHRGRDQGPQPDRG